MNSLIRVGIAIIMILDSFGKSFGGLLRRLEQSKITIFDSLLFSPIPYYLLFSICLLAYHLIFSHAWVLVFIVYTLLPLLDELFSLDSRNPTEKERLQLQKDDLYFKLALYAAIAIDWFLFFRVMHYFAELTFDVWSCFNLVAFLFLFSNLNSVQFAVAHEIFHKQGLFFKVLGTAVMSKNLYMHFTYEHLQGHHRKVATREDPASAEKGIPVYEFVRRSFFGSYKSVYAMDEAAGTPLLLNKALLSVAAAVLFTFAIYCAYGAQTCMLFLISALGSIFYLEAINYLEHYGLRRKLLQDGTYEKVTIKHSWNAPHRFSNYLLFKLQRHSDHHENSMKPYQTLVSLDESPFLPHGYSVAIFLSFFPSSWFEVMDPMVDSKDCPLPQRQAVRARSSALTQEFIGKLGVFTTAMAVISLAHCP